LNTVPTESRPHSRSFKEGGLGLERNLANHIAELALSKDPKNIKKFIDLATGNPKIGRFVRLLDTLSEQLPKASGYLGQEGASNPDAMRNIVE